MKHLEMKTIVLKTALKDKCVPDDFYSTTNHSTFILTEHEKLFVENQRMDAMIVVDSMGAHCKKLREIKAGDLIVCGDNGVIVTIDGLHIEEDEDFGFMGGGVSSERRNELLIKDIAMELASGKKLTVVAGPVVVHTGGDVYLTELIEKGYVQSLLAGNAVAVHDIEKQYYGTSLGVCSKSGRNTKNGYKNHMRAINRVYKFGSIADTVKAGDLTSGIMHACVKHNVPYVLAGSLRDDGPLPDTLTDMIKAQNAYSKYLATADIVIVLGSMLHGIASGNMLASRIPMICVDINPAVVTKLSDRGSGQASGIVTDVGLFLSLLTKEIESVTHKPDTFYQNLSENIVIQDQINI